MSRKIKQRKMCYIHHITGINTNSIKGGTDLTKLAQGSSTSKVCNIPANCKIQMWSQKQTFEKHIPQKCFTFFRTKFRRGRMGWIYLFYKHMNNGKDHRLRPCAMWNLPKHFADAMLKFGSAVLAEYYSKLLPCYLYCLFGGISVQVCPQHFSAITPNSKMTFASQSSLI